MKYLSTFEVMFYIFSKVFLLISFPSQIKYLQCVQNAHTRTKFGRETH